MHVISQRGEHHRQDVLPLRHLYGQDGQAHAQLDPHGFGSPGVLLDEREYLVAQSWEIAFGDLGCEVVRYLAKEEDDLVRGVLLNICIGDGGLQPSRALSTRLTLPFNVVAAKRSAFASASDWRIEIVIVQASSCRSFRQ